MLIPPSSAPKPTYVNQTFIQNVQKGIPVNCHANYPVQQSEGFDGLFIVTTNGTASTASGTTQIEYVIYIRTDRMDHNILTDLLNGAKKMEQAVEIRELNKV
ncbi:hypothetical protein HYW87_01705 [Candidatus Roizmanbacteria bacterium]|nr:hypothetical protein [Candidatus Roizmanbacteria bacterium]